MKKVFIVHGFESLPNRGFYPWLMSEIFKKSKNFAVSLEMPNPNFPVCSEWISKINNEVVNPNQNTYLVGHSLGVPAILRYLETLHEGQKIGGVFLVAGFVSKLDQPDPDSNIRKIDNFLEKPFDFNHIKKVCDVFHIIHGSDDNVVPISNAEFLAEQLDTTVFVIKGAGHFPSSKVFEIPELLEIILKEL